MDSDAAVNFPKKNFLFFSSKSHNPSRLFCAAQDEEGTVFSAEFDLPKNPELFWDAYYEFAEINVDYAIEDKLSALSLGYHDTSSSSSSATTAVSILLYLF